MPPSAGGSGSCGSSEAQPVHGQLHEEAPPRSAGPAQPPVDGAAPPLKPEKPKRILAALGALFVLGVMLLLFDRQLASEIAQGTTALADHQIHIEQVTTLQL